MRVTKRDQQNQMTFHSSDPTELTKVLRIYRLATAIPHNPLLVTIGRGWLRVIINESVKHRGVIYMAKCGKKGKKGGKCGK